MATAEEFLDTKEPSKLDSFLDSDEQLDLSGLAPAPKPKQGAFTSGLKRGFGSLTAEVGQLTGAEGLKRAGEATEEANPQQVPLGEFGKRPGAYIAETVGEQAPRLALSFGSAYSGAALGTMVGGPGLGTAVGAAAGLLLSSFLQEKGGIQRERVQEGKEAGGLRENAGAAAAASLDLLGVGRPIRMAAKGLVAPMARESLKAGESRALHVGKQALKTGAQEAVTEAPQEVIENVAAEKQNVFEGAGEAGVKGGILGALLGGSFGAFTPRAHERASTRDLIDAAKKETRDQLGLPDENFDRASFDNAVLGGLGGAAVAGAFEPKQFQQDVLAGITEPREPPGPPGGPPLTFQPQVLDIVDQAMGRVPFDEAAQRRGVLEGLGEPAVPAPVPRPAAQPLTGTELDNLIFGGTEAEGLRPGAIRSRRLPVQQIREQGLAQTVETLPVENIVYPETTNLPERSEAQVRADVEARAAELAQKPLSAERRENLARKRREEAHKAAEAEVVAKKAAEEEKLAKTARVTRLGEAAERVVAGEKVADRVQREDADTALKEAQKDSNARSLPTGLREMVYRAMKLGTKANRALQIAGLGSLLRGMNSNTKSYEIVGRLYERIAGRKFDEVETAAPEAGRRTPSEGAGAKPVQRPGAGNAAPAGGGKEQARVEKPGPAEKPESKEVANVEPAKPGVAKVAEPAGPARPTAAERPAAGAARNIQGPSEGTTPEGKPGAAEPGRAGEKAVRGEHAERDLGRKGVSRAVQEPSTEGVPVREAPGGREGVRVEDTEGRAAPPTREERKAAIEARAAPTGLMKSMVDQLQRLSTMIGGQAAPTETEEARKAGRGVPEPVEGVSHIPPDAKKHASQASRTLAEAKKEGGNILKQWWRDLNWAAKNRGNPIADYILSHPDANAQNIKLAARRELEYAREAAVAQSPTIARMRKIAAAKEKASRETAKREAAKGAPSTRRTAKEVLKILEEWDPNNDTLESHVADNAGYNHDFHVGLRRLSERFGYGPIPLNAVLDLMASASRDTGERAMINELFKKLNIPTKVQLVPLIEKIKRVGDQEVVVRVPADYNPVTDTIRLSEPSDNFVGGTDTRTALHEVVHAVLAHRTALAAKQFLDGVPVEQLTPEDRQARDTVRELLGIFEQVKQVAVDQNVTAYAFTNVDEFLAEALTNPSFQTWLRGLEYKGERPSSLIKTIWHAIVDVVRKFLAPRAKKFDVDVLDAVMSYTPDLYRTTSTDLETANIARQHLRNLGFYESDPELTMDRGHGAAVEVLGDGMNKLTTEANNVLGSAGRGMVSVKDSTRRGLLLVMSFKNIVAAFERYFPALRDIGEAQNKQRATAQGRNIAAANIVNRVQDWAQKNGGWDAANPDSTKSKPALLYNLMEQTTLHGIDPRLEMKQQKNFQDSDEYRKAYSDIMSMWERLGGEGKSLWTQMEAYNRDQYDAMYGQLVENLVRLFGDKEIPAGATTQQLAQLARDGEFGTETKLNMAQLDGHYNRVQGPYFHIGRYGDYFIRWQDAPGEEGTQHFEMFETRAQFDKRVAELTAEGKNNKKENPAWEAGKLSERVESLDQGSWKFVRSMIEKIDDSNLDADQRELMKNTIRQLYLQMLPETSSQKMFARRKGTAGWDRDMIRNFAKRAEVGNYQLAHAQAAVPMSDAIGKFKDQLKVLRQSGDKAKTELGLFGSDIETELRTRQAQIMKQPNTPIVDKLTSLNYAFYLGLSPAFLLVNLLQPYQMTLPVVGGKFGHAKTALEMAKSAGTAFKMLRSMMKGNLIYPDLDIEQLVKNKTLTAEQGEFLQDALGSGRIDITLAHEIGEVRRHGAADKFSRTMHVLGLASHYSEVQNRITAGLAAFNMARKSGMEKEKAIEYANRIIDATQFDYTSQNQARIMGKHGFAGPITPIFTAFQRYNMQSLELMGRLVMESFGGLGATTQEAKEARRALLGLFTTTGVMAGALGLPAVGLITAVINKLFGSDDEPLDAKAEFRNFLADTFGKETAEVIARGGPRVIGVDLSSRVGFDNIVPFTRFLSDKRKLKDMMESQALDILGPVVGGAVNMMYGASQIADGQTTKGLEKMMPLAPLRNVAKASELAGGSVTDARGNKIPVEVNGWDIMNQLLGLTPRPLAERSEALYAINTRTRELQETTGKIRQQMYRALEDKDLDAIAKARSDIVAFNTRHPEFAITGIGQGFVRRERALEVGRREGTGVGVSSMKNLPRLDIGRFANLE